jgi:tetraacyldisaccharide 4'-kinase
VRSRWPVALALAARLYGTVAERRLRRAKPYRARLPVICVGNFTAGGSGKTPLVAHLAGLITARGLKPAILSRGYGGRRAGPMRVDPAHDTAADVGDEPLQLARDYAVVVARNRAAGAKAIADDGSGFDVIVMDDGLQNGDLAKDVTLAVVDGVRGLGNGAVIPAGPLRAPLAAQFERVDAIVVNMPASMPDDTPNPVMERLATEFPGPVLTARLGPLAPTDWLSDTSWIAFAGIGSPDRFFSMLDSLGAKLIERRGFPDHHAYTAEDAALLLALADQHHAGLVTTAKDLTRLLHGKTAHAALAARARVIEVGYTFSDRDRLRLDALIAPLLAVKS